jgi:hypothetical protein
VAFRKKNSRTNAANDMLPLWIPAIAAVDIKFPHFLCEESERRSNLKFRLPIKIQALKNTDFTLRYFVLKPTMFWLGMVL